MNEYEERILDILEEIRKWVKFSGWNNVKEILTETLVEPEDKKAYSMTDGNTGIRTIRDAVGLSYGKIHSLWRSWVQIGIAENIPYGIRSRAKASFSLEDFGIEIPGIESEASPSNEEEENE